MELIPCRAAVSIVQPELIPFASEVSKFLCGSATTRGDAS